MRGFQHSLHFFNFQGPSLRISRRGVGGNRVANSSTQISSWFEGTPTTLTRLGFVRRKCVLGHAERAVDKNRFARAVVIHPRSHVLLNRAGGVLKYICPFVSMGRRIV